MAMSLTPNPETEAEYLATVLSANQVRLACRDHGTSIWDFYRERGGYEKPVTLQELRDWLGY
jgi:hypothetical protein